TAARSATPSSPVPGVRYPTQAPYSSRGRRARGTEAEDPSRPPPDLVRLRRDGGGRTPDLKIDRPADVRRSPEETCGAARAPLLRPRSPRVWRASRAAV